MFGMNFDPNALNFPERMKYTSGMQRKVSPEWDFEPAARHEPPLYPMSSHRESRGVFFPPGGVDPMREYWTQGSCSREFEANLSESSLQQARRSLKRGRRV